MTDIDRVFQKSTANYQTTSLTIQVEAAISYPYNFAPPATGCSVDVRTERGMKSATTGRSLPKPPVHRVLLMEGAVVFLAAALVRRVDPVAGYSILLGGGLYLVPQAWFCLRVFRRQGARAVSEVVQGFYRGEAAKFLLAAAGFATVFVMVKPLHPLALFGAYVGLHILNTISMSRFSWP